MQQTQVEFLKSEVYVPYEQALTTMQKRVKGIIAGTAKQALWFLEHPPLYTAGTSANDNDLLNPRKFTVYQSGRGGQYTYHGPGQRVAYVMLDLNQVHNRAPDLKKFVKQLENWIILTLAEFGLKSESRPARIGIWVVNPDGTEDKIAAIGIRVEKWVSYHGIAINISPNLADYDGIVPCGQKEHGVTSLLKLGHDISMQTFDRVFAKKFCEVFAVELVG